MAALTGTVTLAGKNGEIGQQYLARGSYTFGAEIEDTDTITWSNILPAGGAKVVGFRVYGQEIDTNATPTATFIVGNTDDTDGYLKTKGGAVGLQNSLAGQLFYAGDGDLITSGSIITNRNVVLTMTAATATGASSGTIYIELVLEGA